jgi:hypothetical protein
MEPLNPIENDLTVKLIRVGNHLEGDATAERIQWLTSGILEKIAFSKEAGAWETLFKDKNDGRYWERTYPQSGMHGGGPPRLWCISEEEARKKYDF